MLATVGLVLPGCVARQSQLLQATPADEDTAQRALATMAGFPPPGERSHQVVIEQQGSASVALGYFRTDLPASFQVELVTPFGVTLIEIQRDVEGAQVLSGSGPLRRLLTLGKFPRLLGLWLLGDCTSGEVWTGATGVAVDCPANGPDTGLTWRIWIDEETGERPRGELLRGKRLLADYTCDADGRCVLQDLQYGYALRLVPMASP